MKKHLITMPKRILAVLAVLLLGLVTVSPAYADTHTGETTTTPTFTFAALPLPTPTYGTGELAIQRTSAPDATGYRFTATIMGNGVFVGTNNSRTSVLNTDPQHGGASTQYVICVPETVMINVADSTGAVVASLPAGANQAGSKDLRSCPEGPSEPADTDKDGVTDDKDNCPNVAGPATNGGCPLPVDTDKDGVADDQDKCPAVAGPASNGGCPVPADTDQDGVTDDKDGCIDVAGPASNNGCPLPVDTDKDGVTDDKDKCVDVAGPATNNGCPVDVPPKKAAVCKYVGTPGVDERLQTGQNPIVVDRKDWMVIGSPFQDAHGRSIVIAFLNPQDPEPSVDQCPAPVVDACPDMEGSQPAGTDCKPETPATCPPGMGWKDSNDNGKIDEGECVKRTSPISGPPAVVNPPVVAPPVDDVTPVVPVKVETSVEVDTTVEQVVVVSEGDETNGRGVTAETAAVATSAEESVVGGSVDRTGFGLVGLAILLAVAVWQLRPGTSE